jgi:hypothetical protein
VTDILPLVVAVLGAGGAGAFFREIIAGVLKVIGGVSARESKRKIDIVQQRDEALARATAADLRADAEAEKRRRVQENEARLRRLCIVNGIDPGEELEFEQTLTKKQLAELRNPKEIQ